MSIIERIPIPDSVWFEQHPGQRFRYRAPNKDEWGIIAPFHPGAMIEVEQLAKGIRVKRSYVVLPSGGAR